MRQGPISSKRVSSPDPLLRKFGNFRLNNLNFHPNCSSQAPKFGNFSSQAPNWEIFSSQAPFSEANSSLQAPHFGNPGRTPLPEKKLSALLRVIKPFNNIITIVKWNVIKITQSISGTKSCTLVFLMFRVSLLILNQWTIFDIQSFIWAWREVESA